MSTEITHRYSRVARPKIGGGKMFHFRRRTLFCLEKRLSKNKMTISSKHLRGPWPLWTPWLRLCTDTGKKNSTNPVSLYQLLSFCPIERCTNILLSLFVLFQMKSYTMLCCACRWS